jgi:hypothetical protein
LITVYEKKEQKDQNLKQIVVVDEYCFNFSTAVFKKVTIGFFML